MADNGRVVEVSDSDFTEKIEDADGLAIVDFWAEWCGPCKIVGPIVEQLAEDFEEQGLVVGKLDVDSNPQTASRFGVRSIPSILFFKNGELVDSVIGAVPKAQLQKKIEAHL